MASSLVRSIELLVSEPAVTGRLASPRPVGRVVPSEFDVDAGLLEALDIVLDGSARGTDPIIRERASEREARLHEIERRLAERGGWDEV